MNALSILANYLTGPRVAQHSIGLQVGGEMGEKAKKFFELRKVFGITGYIGALEAHGRIKATIMSEMRPDE